MRISVQQENGMKVLVVGPSDTKSRGGMATVIRDIRYSKVLNSRFDINIFASYIDGKLPVRLLYCMGAFLRFLMIYKQYDLFHLNTASYGSTFRKNWYLKVIKKAGKKAVVHIHGSKYLVFYEQLNERRRKQVLQYLNSADLVLALSRDWKEKFDTIFGLENCQVLENGIDVDTYAEAITRNQETVHSFAVLGRLGQRKGTYDLLDAVETAAVEVPDLKCYLAGDGEVEKVKEKIQERGLENHISVLGWIEGKEKIRLLKKISTVVLPSYHEGLPMSILEGMAAGKAIISTNVGAIPEVVGKENGILIEAGDIQALADALIRCCKDTELVKQMSANNVDKVHSRFSIERMHTRLAEYYEQIK